MAPGALKPAGNLEQLAPRAWPGRRGRQGKSPALQIERGKVVSQVSRMGDGLLDEVVDSGGVRRLRGAALGQLELQPFGHERQPGELLAKIIVQIQADAPPLFLGDFQQLIFQALAFGDGGMELGVGGLELGGALVDPHSPARREPGARLPRRGGARGGPWPRAARARPPGPRRASLSFIT